MMDDDMVDAITNAYCMEPVIEAPFGVMTGEPTPLGSRIPYGRYTMPYEGGIVHITGMCWGHGTLFLYTEEFGQTGVKFPYEIKHRQKYVDDEDDPQDDEPKTCELIQANLERWGFVA